jgi:hypothetical protein
MRSSKQATHDAPGGPRGASVGLLVDDPVFPEQRRCSQTTFFVIKKNRGFSHLLVTPFKLEVPHTQKSEPLNRGVQFFSPAPSSRAQSRSDGLRRARGGPSVGATNTPLRATNGLPTPPPLKAGALARDPIAACDAVGDHFAAAMAAHGLAAAVN